MEHGLPPEPCAATNAEARLHGTVFFAVLPGRPDKHTADEDERDENEHESDDLCSRHFNSVAASRGLPQGRCLSIPLARTPRATPFRVERARRRAGSGRVKLESWWRAP